MITAVAAVRNAALWRIKGKTPIQVTKLYVGMVGPKGRTSASDGIQSGLEKMGTASWLKLYCIDIWNCIVTGGPTTGESVSAYGEEVGIRNKGSCSPELT